MGALYFSLYGLNVTCLRFLNVFGPRQLPTSSYSGVVSKFAERASLKLRPVIFGAGDQLRDFIYVGDVINALILSMQSTISGYAIYNIGTGLPMTIKSLWDIFSKFAQTKILPEYLPPRSGDIAVSLADISLAQKELNFKTSLNNEVNFFETYRWSQKLTR